MDAFSEIQKQVDAGAIAGAVALVADSERILKIRSIGLADSDARRPMRDDTLFWIASVSKPITAALLMTVVDEGTISLDDPLEKYLPAFADPNAPTITIRQAMSHTSGLPFFSRPEKTIDLYPLAEAAMSYAMSPRMSVPNFKYRYGNIGINTVGRIIEVVSDKPFEQLLAERLLAPLGMVDTTFIPTDAQLARLATPYKLDETKTHLIPTMIDQLRYPLNDPTRHPAPAGGLFSTASDVARFGQMVLNGGTFAGRKILSRSAVATMTSTQTGTLQEHHGPGTGYGIGFETFGSSTDKTPADKAPADRCGHGGALSNHLDINPHTGRVNVFMVQQQGWLTPEAALMRERFNDLAGDVQS